MKISIFPLANPHPGSKPEKRRESLRTSFPFMPELVAIDDIDGLYDVVTTRAWSPFIYAAERCEDGFLETNFLVLDIDDGMTIQEAERACERANLEALITPSVSHTKELHKFRVIFPLLCRITDKDTYKATWNKLRELLPFIDVQCKDLARYYFAGRDSEEAVYIEGNLLTPVVPLPPKKYTGEYTTTKDFEDKDILEVLYGEIPTRIPDPIAYFLSNAHSGMSGEWNCSLNACVFTLALQNVKEDAILHVLETIAPEPLDKNDMGTVKRAYKQGSEKSWENEDGV